MKKLSKTFKPLACKRCGEIVPKVDISAEAVTCSDCVQLDLLGGVRITEEQYWSLVKSEKLNEQDCTNTEE